ncbi:flagellar biosynthetic protein FliO [Nesterenkonia sandarakina]|uniref:Flagellar protein n=1 Tax=Nesterenkonia sandarakina TaxID=272918 RepID=A0A7Z0E8I0_9MICC|nr:flagellar biosynthetic protein FliO [Nesterenkonia sandarakina]
MDSFFLLLRVAVSLAAVLGLIWYLNRRFAGRGRSASPQAVSLIGRQALGQKSSVAVVEIDDRRYVLGVAEQAVTLLETYPAPEKPALPEVHGAPPEAGPGRGFEQKLRSAIALAQGKPIQDQNR